jgi:FK506-binding nuclear protein
VVITELEAEPEPPKGKRAAQAPAAAAPPAKKPAASPAPAAAKAGAKPGSQFADGPPGSLGSRKFDNGMEVINLGAGKPDGKVALPGKRVSMQYTGRLKANGKVFDASKGKAFVFRLGVGEVIKGWDIGVKGMRVGDKRRLIIPPEFGYGKKGAPGAIPPNAWLEFDVELVNVIG